MKKIFTGVIAIALAVVAVAPSAASAQTMSGPCPFVSSLKKRMRSDEVKMLQAKLGVIQTGYYGSLTAAAVANYQTGKGLPRVGVVGPLTRAALCADYSMNPGTIGNPNPVNPNPVVTSGIEGSLDVKLAASPANNANVQTNSDVAVYGLEFKARLNDVVVQTLDLQTAVTLSSSAENPSTLINTIKVWDGSSVLATIPVNSTTFTKDSNQVYYIRLAGLNFAVPKDVTKFLTVSFSTNSIDSDRVVTLDGYNSSSIRAVSGNGISSFYSADTLTRTHTFKKPGTSTLTLSAATNPLRSQNFRINPDNGVMGATVLTFNVKSETGDSKILTVNASTTASGTLGSTLYLYDGSTLLASKTIVTSGAAISFDNLEVIVPKDVTKTLTIKADLPSNTTTGSFSSTTVSSVVFEKPNGSSATATSSAGQVSGVNHYAYTKAAIITLAGAPSISVSNPGVSTGTTTMTAVFPLNIRAEGGNVVIPGATGAEFTVVFSNGTPYTATAKSVVTIPNNDIADGSTAQVTVTASVNPSVAVTNGLYNAALTSIAWNAGNGTTTQTYGLDDFKTSQAVQFNR